jgi:hypothetical protein
MTRDACLRALYKAASGKPNTLTREAKLAKDLDVPQPLLGFLLRRLAHEGLITIQVRAEGSMIELTQAGLVAGLALMEDRSRPKTKILCIDTEPEVVQGLEAAGYVVHDVSMGYRTGKRDFAFPAPNEVDLMVCDLRRPACFDTTDWGPSGSNNNFQCRTVPFEQVDNTFTVRGDFRAARFQVIRESQLGDPIPGTFGPKEVNRAVGAAGVPFLLFLNHEWLDRVISVPNWANINWVFGHTSASQVDLVDPLPTVMRELGAEIKFKLVVRHLIKSGPEARQKPSPYEMRSSTIVRNNVGEIFGQVVNLGRGTLWLIPQTHQNVSVIGLFAARLDRIRHLSDRQEPKSERVPPAIGPLENATQGTAGPPNEIRRGRSVTEVGTGTVVVPAKPSSPNRVFIGHGRSQVWRELKDFLNDRLRLEWDEFNRESVAGKSTKERLQAMLAASGFAFLVMTGEDADSEGVLHARENVIHEAGLFQGHLGFERAIILLEDGCKEFSNIHGLTHLSFPKGRVSAVFEDVRKVLEREGLLSPQG